MPAIKKYVGRSVPYSGMQEYKNAAITPHIIAEHARNTPYIVEF